MKSFIYPIDKRVLQIAHNHPNYSPGGTELTALALHHHALKLGMDSWFLGATEKLHLTPNLGTQMVAITPDNRECAIFTWVFDRFQLSQPDSYGFLWELRNYLNDIKPDIVHIHHLLNFGLEVIYIIKRCLPDAKIYLTLHDYYTICANNGQLYKHDTNERCSGPDLRKCVQCLVDHGPNDFTMRRLAIENALSLCDKIISPSDFLKAKTERYLALTREIEVVENDYFGPDVVPAPFPSREDRQVQFGYVGNISAIKGLADLLDACEILIERQTVDFRLHVHGSQLFPDDKLKTRIENSTQTLGRRVKYHGKYERDDIPRVFAGIDCLVFPSVWWENAPLVVYEALHHNRPVIAYPHGGAPEILKRYQTGILAESSDSEALASAMEKAAGPILQRRLSMQRQISQGGDADKKLD
jgi:glycosyltransferase involved in cell wall biosynthesis